MYEIVLKKTTSMFASTKFSSASVWNMPWDAYVYGRSTIHTIILKFFTNIFSLSLQNTIIYLLVILVQRLKLSSLKMHLHRLEKYRKYSSSFIILQISITYQCMINFIWYPLKINYRRAFINKILSHKPMWKFTTDSMVPR